jgi:hypothetical protein
MVHEAVLASGMTVVFGKEETHSALVKNQSSCSNKGWACIFDHVNLLPFKGSSSRHKCPIISLKRNISFTSSPGLFLFSSDLMKLKSPISNQLLPTGI